jgi:hypothetical protein
LIEILELDLSPWAIPENELHQTANGFAVKPLTANSFNDSLSQLCCLKDDRLHPSSAKICSFG